MKHFITLVTVLLFVMLVGYGYEELSESPIPAEESELARSILNDFRNGDVEKVSAMLSDEIRNQADDEVLREIASYFHPGEPISVEIIGSQVNVFGDKWTGNFTFEYQFDAGWNLANVALSKRGEEFEIFGLNVYRTEASQRELNRFSFDGKSLAHYVVFVLTIACPIFILVTLGFFFRTPIAVRKWMWFFFIIVGIGTIELNWTTGEYAFRILHLQLLGAGFVAMGPHAAWVLSASAPIGAIAFWIKRSKLSQNPVTGGDA